MKLNDGIARFVQQLRADGRNASTIATYDRYLRVLDGWLRTYSFDDTLQEIRPEVLAAFLISNEAKASAHGGTKTTASLNAVRTTIRIAFTWFHAAGFTQRNQARLVRRAITTPPPPRSLTDLELRKLEDALILGRGPTARRDHALIAVLLHSGVRLGSAIALDRDDVDLDNQSLHLRSVKGDRPGSRVFFGSALHDHLVGYLANKPRTGPLFRGPGGERLSKRQAQKRIALWFERAEITATPHSLRHTFGTRLLRKTGDLFLVQRAMLHKSVVSTTAYLSVSDDRLKAALQ